MGLSHFQVSADMLHGGQFENDNHQAKVITKFGVLSLTVSSHAITSLSEYIVVK